MNALPRQGYRFTLMHSVSAIALHQSHPWLAAAVGFGDGETPSLAHVTAKIEGSAR